MKQMGRMIIVGGTLGVGGAIFVGRAAQSLLFGVSGFDPVVLGAVAALLALVALGAAYLPAARASRVDPMSALRYE